MIDEKLREILVSTLFNEDKIPKIKALVVESLGEEKDCNDCKYISTTEELQNYQEVKSPHVCELLNQRIYHAGRHPLLKPLGSCPINQHITEMKKKWK